jgi:osmotically-inducible protein OsmY
VCEHLRDDERVDASDVTVTAAGGVVTLEGTVPMRWMKHYAEDLACHCGGVKDVRNQLAVKREERRGEESRDTPRGGFGAAGDGGRKH